MKDPTEIIIDYFSERCECPDLVYSLFKWMGEDDLVKWFVDAYFVRDENDMRQAMDEEDMRAILEHYELHCR